MKIRTFNIPKVIEGLSGYKPSNSRKGGYEVDPANGDNENSSDEHGIYEMPPTEPKAELSPQGLLLRRQSALGRWYFMPVSIVYTGGEVEIPNAIIKITCEKTIIKTPLVGLQGTVKEFIGINDYNINITGTAVDQDWPESQIVGLHELFKENEPVTLKCALTDLFLEDEDKIVITKMDFPDAASKENVQPFTIDCVSDRQFTLTVSDV